MRRSHRSPVLELLNPPVVRLRIVFHDLALEYPDLDADDPVGGHGLGPGIVDVGAQRVQRHPTFPVPLGPGDLDTARDVRRN